MLPADVLDVIEVPDVAREAVGGIDDSKEQLRETIQWPLEQVRRRIREVFNNARENASTVVFFNELVVGAEHFEHAIGVVIPRSDDDSLSDAVEASG